MAVVSKKYDTEKAKDLWSFHAPKKSAVPEVHDAAWVRTDIDRFVLAGLEAKGLKPVADADKLTLIRRVYFDLVGVPPSLDEITAFVQDKSTNAFITVVDRLLGSPQFGERWGRHWLDVARYAESSGKEANFAYPHAWRYRDYVIGAFNADKPYDEFLREQIAGDLLPAKNERERAQHEVATGYLAIGAKSQNEQNPRQYALDMADEQIDAISEGILGITIACARCHDHKFDPIPQRQREYYAMAGHFPRAPIRATALRPVASKTAMPPRSSNCRPIRACRRFPRRCRRKSAAQKEKQLASSGEGARRLRGRAHGRAQRQGKPGNVDVRKAVRLLALGSRRPDCSLRPKLRIPSTPRDARRFSRWARRIVPSGEFRRSGGFGRYGSFGGGGSAGGKAGRFYGNITAFPTITDSPLYTRGDVDKPGDKVPRGFISILTDGQAPTIQEGTSGRRELAEWITSANNPLTSRVMVNRMWHWLFGRGIVESTDNFGSTGHLPSNQPLLDNLSIEFRDKGYSVKKMIREIVLSHAYQLSSTYNAADFAADPENTLVWRMSKRRLDAECIRDAMLSVSGDLQYTAPIGDAIAMAGDGMINGPRGRGMTEGQI